MRLHFARTFDSRLFHAENMISKYHTFTPAVAQKGPYKVELEPQKRYSWCSCGLSSKQPFCDGKHKEVGLKPVRFTVEEKQVASLCGCKRTKTPPYCDASCESF